MENEDKHRKEKIHGELHSGIWEMLSALKAFNENILEPYAQKQGLTFLQSRVLMGIKHGKITTVGGLAEHASLYQGNASTLCKRLEQQGFLRRERSSVDERVVNLILTEKGLTAAENIMNRMQYIDSFIEQNAKDDIKTMRDGAKAFLKIVSLITENEL
ncbi:MAG TPA: MarR family winged helix-turn-helix transcriptional regulator [Oscillospiraceae bacterium]|nr:MarR family winged helix-turn-helix transcriptional regulator [Oscillospiraceae bacterium]HPF56165.1 MarR family winged helix-turn-helix transcriptional regulator [Clostridiales bacterium]HPK36056.1 MarR family winged helix-turn-helix transcriptional regulator [Oscillospiraceae bacterium]HPR75987.1 MarR family winged helix-turn-helix transcriptional regulator [Oscillospiraceae bacterium]